MLRGHRRSALIAMQPDVSRKVGFDQPNQLRLRVLRSLCTHHPLNRRRPPENSTDAAFTLAV